MTRRFAALAALAAAALACQPATPPETRETPAAETAARATGGAPAETAEPGRLPMRPGSVRFAVIGDSGRGDRHQYMTAAKMIEWRQWFDYSFVLMLGDNIYGEEGTPEAYARRFEIPYKPLLDAGVTFHAALGNHDPPDQENYPLFNMNGRRYYTFEKEAGVLPILEDEVLFMAIDTVNLTPQQLRWVESELAASDAEWKIAYYHHPLYTSGRYQFWAARLRSALEPIFVEHGVDVALSGHEHFYERIRPQKGIQYFVSGAAGALRINDLRESEWTAAGFDTDTHFMLMEITGDALHFLAISRKGEIVDWGTVPGRDD